MLVAHHDQVRIYFARIAGNFTYGVARQHLALGRMPRLREVLQPLLQDGLVVGLFPLRQLGVVEAALSANKVNVMRHNRNQCQCCARPLHQSPAIQQRLLAGFGTVVSQQNLLVHVVSPVDGSS